MTALRRPGPRWVAWAARGAGPAVIVAVPLLLLPGFWLGARLTGQHVDLLPFWLPRWCFLGRSLASGHVPTWLPHQFAGVPFASDPQSGWLYLPAMVLFSVASCGRALGVLVALNPVLAGLGLYGFLRTEGLGRPAATVGGLVLAAPMAGSVVVLSMPFAATLAWTSLALAAAAAYVRARTAPSLLGWLGAAALALSQVAAAHLTNGLAIGLLVTGLYVAARSAAQVRAGERTPGAAALRGVALFAGLPLLGAAVLLPRLVLVPRTTIGLGYRELAALAARVAGTPAVSPLARSGASAWWGTSFARGPGGYVGALGVLLVPLALRSPRWRLPAAGFALAGLVGWALRLDALVGAEPVRRAVAGTALGELWLRDPNRFAYLVPLALAALAGYGVQAWLDLDRPVPTPRALRRLAWAVPSVLVFAVAPLAAGSPARPYLPLALGTAATLPALVLAARGRRLGPPALPAVLAVELAVVGLVGLQPPTPPGRAPGPPPAEGRFGHAFARLRRPGIDSSAYLTPGPIGVRLMAGTADRSLRYLSFRPGLAARQVRGARSARLAVDPSAYADGRSLLFAIDDVEGYSPVQLPRYWRLVRRVDRLPLFYSAATFASVDPALLRLLAVGWVVLPQGVPPPPGSRAEAAEGSHVLYALPGATPRASVVFDWEVATPGRALEAVLAPGFDPERRALLEARPRVGDAAILPRPTASGWARYRQLGPGHVRVEVEAGAPGVVVVRNAHDRGWRATVDGSPAPLLVADYLLQGVAVPAGRHVVDLTYRDPAIGVGLAVSASAWGALGGAALWGGRRRRSRARRAAAPPRSRASARAEPARP